MKKRRYSTQFYFSVFIGIVLIGIFMVTLVVNPTTMSTHNDDGDVINNAPAVNTPAPTQLRLPSPNPNGVTLTMAEPVVSQTGLFSITVPEGWTNIQNTYDPNLPGARVRFNNGELFSVIEAVVQDGVNFPTHEALSDDLLDSNYFFNVWGEYDGFEEVSRTVDEAVTIDFNLQLQNVQMAARQVAWLDSSQMNVLRLVVPGNDPNLLDALTDQVLPAFVPSEDLRDSNLPSIWSAFSDVEQGFMILHPNWQRVSGAESNVAVLRSTNPPGRLEMRSEAETAIDSLDDAEAFAAGILDPRSEILSSQATARQFGEGYLVSFQTRDSDGNPVAGLVALLNDENGNVAIAEIQLIGSSADLLSAEQEFEESQIRDMIRTFTILPPEGYANVPSENPPDVRDVISAVVPTVTMQNLTQNFALPEQDDTQEE